MDALGWGGGVWLRPHQRSYGLREFSVPVHVARSLLPKMKKVWWYPYDAATTETLRAFTDAIAAPTLVEKAKAARVAAGSFRKAVKNKV